jgi:hypothetical protein
MAFVWLVMTLEQMAFVWLVMTLEQDVLLMLLMHQYGLRHAVTSVQNASWEHSVFYS